MITHKLFRELKKAKHSFYLGLSSYGKIDIANSNTGSRNRKPKLMMSVKMFELYRNDTDEFVIKVTQDDLFHLGKAKVKVKDGKNGEYYHSPLNKPMFH